MEGNKNKLVYGEYFRLLGKYYSVSQAEIAKCIGRSQKTISRYINDEGSDREQKLELIVKGIEQAVNQKLTPAWEEEIGGPEYSEWEERIYLDLPKNALDCARRIQEIQEKLDKKQKFDYEYHGYHELTTEDLEKAERFEIFQDLSEEWYEMDVRTLRFILQHLEESVVLGTDYEGKLNIYREFSEKGKQIFMEAMEEVPLKYEHLQRSNGIGTPLLSHKLIAYLTLQEDSVMYWFHKTYQSPQETSKEEMELRLGGIWNLIDFARDHKRSAGQQLHIMKEMCEVRPEEWFLLLKWEVYNIEHEKELYALYEKCKFVN